MDSNNQAARPTQPIRDISSPGDNLLGNPTQFANVPVESAPDSQPMSQNPIAGGSPPPSHQPAPPPIPAPKTDDLERVLKDVNRDVKTSIQKPRPLSRPTLVIAAAVVIGVTLMVLAFFAFRKSS